MSDSAAPARGSQSPPANAANEASAQVSEREAQLAKVPFFDGLTPEALSMIAGVMAEENHAPGTKIFGYGEPGDKLYIVVEGKVRISREVGGMGEEALAVLGAGEVFGEMALLDESPRSADAKAHDRCRLLVITKDAFDDLRARVRVREELARADDVRLDERAAPRAEVELGHRAGDDLADPRRVVGVAMEEEDASVARGMHP